MLGIYRAVPILIGKSHTAMSIVDYMKKENSKQIIKITQSTKYSTAKIYKFNLQNLKYVNRQNILFSF